MARCWLVLTAAPTVFFATMIWTRRWMSDDGFINLRIVENLLAGDGPVFNAGERVEAYTSTLWLGVITALGGVGIPLEIAAVYAGLICSVLGVVFAQLGAFRLWCDHSQSLTAIGSQALVPLGVLIYVVLPPAWDFGTSGLDTGLAIGWLGLSFFAMARFVVADSERKRLPLATVALFGLGPLVRPELALFSFGFLVPLLWAVIRRRSWSPFLLLKLGAAMGAVPVVYQVFRMGYFAALVPNTAIAKVAFDSRWEQGLRYAENFFGLYMLAIPLVVVSGVLANAVVTRCLNRDWLRVTAYVVPPLCGLLYCLYVVYVGGGFMHGRLFLPGLFGMLLPVAVIPLRPRGSSRWRLAFGVGAALVVVGWSLYCATSLRADRENVHGIGDERGWYTRQANMGNPVMLADYEELYFIDDANELRDGIERECERLVEEQEGDDCDPFVYVQRRHGELRPWQASYPMRPEVADRGFEAVVMRSGIGMRSLTLGPEIHVVDRIGLADPVAARKQLRKRGRPGHEKALPNPWYVARFSVPVPGEDARITAARRALECGALAELTRAVEGELTLRRFVKNIERSFRFHHLEFDPDPWEAEAQFCDTSPPTEQLHGGTGGTRSRWDCPEGYELFELSVRRSRQEEALASVQPSCRSGDEVVTGPLLGGSNGRAARTLSCPDAEPLSGISGTHQRFVTGLEAHCGGDEVYEESERFTATCPDHATPTGIVARTGALVDAVGVRCTDTDAP